MTNNAPRTTQTRAGTVFISYARADDERPPYDDTTQGWVKFFWDQLRWELTDRGARQAKLWLDRYDIDPAEAFTQVIKTAVRDATLILPVFSENWVRSQWCHQDITEFVASHADPGSWLIPVFKNDPPRALLPEVMQGENAREGYRFFTQDETGMIHEFYWRGLQNRTAYLELLRRIAQYIIERLDLKTPANREGHATGRTIFLAVAAQDLCDARQRLVNDLTTAGVAVVPVINELPDTQVEYERVIRSALVHAEMAVHLLGENGGITLDGGSEPILKLQLRLVRETAVARPFPRILWVPRWLPGRGHERRDPFAALGRLGGLQPGEELYGEGVTDLSQWLRKRLQAVPTAATVFVTSAAGEDDDLVADLANNLQNLGLRVRAVFASEAMPISDDTAHVLVLWGKADRPALDALLARVPGDARVTCLQLPGDDEQAKRRFFRQRVYLQKIEALPANLQETRELLGRVGIMASGRAL